MLQGANRIEKECLDDEDIDNFPCTDLRTINQLWLSYSGGKFGFSVQKEIYHRLGGTRDYNEEVESAFDNIVGWGQVGSWLNYEDIIFNTSAPLGHLPFCSGLYPWYIGKGWFSSSLASRLVKCNI